MALGTIAAIGGIASAGASLIGGRKAKKDADKAAEQQRQMGIQQANLIAAETEEELRRYDLNVDKTLSTGSALQAASGFGSGGSQDLYMQSVEDEFATERDWMVSVSDQRQEVAKRTGEYQASSLESQGDSALYRGIGGMFGGIATGVGFL